MQESTPSGPSPRNQREGFLVFWKGSRGRTGYIRTP